MTAPIEDDDASAIAAAARVVEINDLYTRMRKTMQVWLAGSDDPSMQTTKAQLNKISEIESAHLLVLKAEDAFDARQKSGNIADAIVDLDEIKSEIGRKLDSLRDAIAESGVSGDIDTGAS
jgi:hypothetical protein